MNDGDSTFSNSGTLWEKKELIYMDHWQINVQILSTRREPWSKGEEYRHDITISINLEMVKGQELLLCLLMDYHHWKNELCPRKLLSKSWRLVPVGRENHDIIWCVNVYYMMTLVIFFNSIHDWLSNIWSSLKIFRSQLEIHWNVLIHQSIGRDSTTFNRQEMLMELTDLFKISSILLLSFAPATSEL